MKQLYCVKLTYLGGGHVSYLTVGGRTAWTIKTARRHAAEIQRGETGILLSELALIEVVPD